mmetsp:Transcript_21013/g.68788  ORF Transcript_21013/g.68788 Transcript_21013/m.68788 type:complete len:230 (+) Transcript_21013:519-1208(+)
MPPAAEPCFMLSIGYGSDAGFEHALHAAHPRCAVELWDGTVAPREQLPGWLTFHGRNFEKGSWRRYRGRRVDILKIDCEGCEYSVLEPLVHQLRPEQEPRLQVLSARSSRLHTSPSAATPRWGPHLAPRAHASRPLGCTGAAGAARFERLPAFDRCSRGRGREAHARHQQDAWHLLPRAQHSALGRHLHRVCPAPPRGCGDGVTATAAHVCSCTHVMYVYIRPPARQDD